MNQADLAILFAQDEVGPGGIVGGIVGGIIYLVIIVVVIAGVWKTFVKAGKPGWAAIVPIYNLIVMLQIAGRPIWWIILLLIPLLNFIFGFIVFADIAKNFGKGIAFAIGLFFLGFIFFPILGFGDARYQPTSEPAIG